MMKTRRILAIVVAAIMLISTLTAIGLLNVNASTTDVGDADTLLSTVTADAAASIKLTANIDMTGKGTIPSFTGTLDGGDYTITLDAPLFDSLSGEVKNLTLAGAIVSDATTAVGALANSSVATLAITNVTNNASVTTTASVSVGGLIGHTRGEYAVTVTNSTNNGAITATNAQGTSGFIGSAVGAGEQTHAVIKLTDCVNNGVITMTGTATDAGAAGFIGYGHRYTANVTRCVNYGDVTSNGTGMAGIFGCAKWSSGATDVDDSFEAYYCANYGDIASTNTGAQGPAGIAGRLSRCDGSAYVIEYCYNVGNVTGGERSGGIFSYTNDVDGTITVKNCYTVGTLTSEKYTHVIGLTGKRKPTAANNYYIGTYNPKTDEAYDEQEKYLGAIKCADQTELNTALIALGEYVVVPGVNDGYAILKWQCPHTETAENCVGVTCTLCGATVAEGTGEHSGEWTETTPATDFADGEATRTCTVCGTTETKVLPATGATDGVYYVGTEEKMVAVMNALNSGALALNAHIVLTDDITLTNGMPSLSSSKTFSGIFDGDGHTISGMKDVMFYYLNGTVKNLTLKGTLISSDKRVGSVARRTTSGATLTNVHSSVNITLAAGDGNVGGLIGYSLATITLTDCSYSGTIDYSWTANKAGIGGVVGYSNADGGTLTMTNCVFNGTLNITTNDAVAENELYAGGVIGYAGTGGKHKISYCVNTGALNLDRASETYFVGGINGKFTLDAGSVTNSVYNGTINAGNSQVGAIVGSSTRAGALIKHCVSLSDEEYPSCAHGSFAEVYFHEYETYKLIGEPFTVGGVTYQQYDFGYINTATSALVMGLESEDAVKPYVSIRDNAASHDLRFVFLTNFAKLNGAESLNVTVTFKTGDTTIKTYTGAVAATEGSLKLYQTVTAAGETYLAADGSAFFALVVTDIPDGAWETATVTITDNTGATVVDGASITYASLNG